MSLSRINHIGIAVSDLEKAVSTFKKLFGVDPEYETLEDRGLRVAIFRLENVRVELTSPIREGTAIDNFLKKRGDGIHHLAFETNDIESTLERLKKEGFEVIDGPREGAEGYLVAFLHPRTTNRVLIEVVSGGRASH